MPSLKALMRQAGLDVPVESTSYKLAANDTQNDSDSKA
jgi:hypothetical protein